LRVAADAIAIADRHIHHAIGAEVHAAGEVAASLPGVGDEDLLDVTKRGALEMSARDRERRALLALLRIRDVDQLVVRELRVHGNEVQRVVRLSRRRR
jgi:hypothetical protein